MKSSLFKIYHKTERLFEKLVSLITVILGNSITFIIALITVTVWLTSKRFFEQDIHECIRDIIHGLIFLSLFIIQKAVNRSNAALHLKVNELVATHEPASNTVIIADKMSEHEVNQLLKSSIELADQAISEDPNTTKPES